MRDGLELLSLWIGGFIAILRLPAEEFKPYRKGLLKTYSIGSAVVVVVYLIDHLVTLLKPVLFKVGL